MGYESFIASKHLTGRHKSGFVSLVSMISVGGVCVGVMALIVVQAVMSGFDRELKNKIVNVQPHIRIEKIKGVDQVEETINGIRQINIPGIQSMAAFIEGQGILKSDSNATGVMVKGVDTAREDLSIYQSELKQGALDFSDGTREVTHRFKRTENEPTGSVILGSGLAARLGARVGSALTLISPFQDTEEGETFSLKKAETRTFIVKGIYRIGMNDFDTSLALISLAQAQQMYHLGSAVTGISIRFFNVDDAEKWKWNLRQVFSNDYYIRSWYDMNHNFFQALKVEKSVMSILLALIILVAAFNIVSSLTMVVMEKTKDIGILRALGATRGSIRSIFVLEGFCIGFWGVVLGGISGLLLATHLNQVSDFLKAKFGLEVFPSDIYFFDKIPADIQMHDVMVTLGFAILVSVVAGFYPAQRAASLNPIEALRYE